MAWTVEAIQALLLMVRCGHLRPVLEAKSMPHQSL